MRLLIILVAMVASASTVDMAEFSQRLLRFDHAYMEFVRVFCGWATVNETSGKCDQRAGMTDVKRFQEARAAAGKLFDLQEAR